MFTAFVFFVSFAVSFVLSSFLSLWLCIALVRRYCPCASGYCSCLPFYCPKWQGRRHPPVQYCCLFFSVWSPLQFWFCPALFWSFGLNCVLATHSMLALFCFTASRSSYLRGSNWSRHFKGTSTLPLFNLSMETSNCL